tara:strand:- start:8026 stop:10092 length:2067 start_codon:yes stop_codon:yes gene_type:complete
MTKKLVRSVERKGMVEVKNTGKGQAQGQAVKINIKIGDTTAQKKKEDEKKKKAKKRRATKRAKKKIIEQIQEELKTIQNLKQDAKTKGISIPAELGALPISVPTSMKGLIELQKEMSQRVVALQQYIASQSETSEIPRIQPQVIPSQGVPAPPIQYQQELIRQRERLVEIGDTGKVEPTRPSGRPAVEPIERPEELTPPVPTPREPTPPSVPADESADLIERLLDDNIKKQKKRLDALVKKGEMKREDADAELKQLIEDSKEQEDKTISAKLGETERKGFEKLEKEKANYERKAKQIAKDIIRDTKSRDTNMYYIDKQDVKELDFEREENLASSQNYQTKYARVIAENADIFGDFFRQSDILYQPNTSRGLIKAFIQNIEKDFKELNEPPASVEPSGEKPLPQRTQEEKNRDLNRNFQAEMNEIRMETNEIAKDIKETLSGNNQRATEELIKRVQQGLNDVRKRFASVRTRLLGTRDFLTKETRNNVKDTLKIINKNRSKATKFLSNVRDGITPVVPSIPLNPTKENALKRLKEYIALKDDILPTDYDNSGFKDLIGNKVLWDLIVKQPTKRLQYSNLQEQLDQWVGFNPNYEADVGEKIDITVEPFMDFRYPISLDTPRKPDRDLPTPVLPQPRPKKDINKPPRSEIVEVKTIVKMEKEKEKQQPSQPYKDALIKGEAKGRPQGFFE